MDLQHVPAVPCGQIQHCTSPLRLGGWVGADEPVCRVIVFPNVLDWLHFSTDAGSVQRQQGVEDKGTAGGPHAKPQLRFHVAHPLPHIWFISLQRLVAIRVSV
jgi:hypothetical protein